MISIKAKLAKNTEEDRQLLVTVGNTLKKFLVWETYLEKGIVDPSPEKIEKDYKIAFDMIMVTAIHNHDQFRDILNRWHAASKNGTLPDYKEYEADAKKLRSQLDVLRASGETRADAAKWMVSRVTAKATQHSAKSLGVDMNSQYNTKKSKKGGMFSSLFSPKSGGVFDANTKDTTEENRAERTIDRDKFKEDRFYRKVLEDDMKRIKKRGGLSDEEQLLVNEHNRLLRAQNGKTKKELSESDKILASMTSGERAMYDISALVGKGLFKAGKGLFNFATKSKKSKEAIDDPTLEAELAAKRIEISEPKDKTLEAELAAKRIEIAEPKEDDAKKEAAYETAKEDDDKRLDAESKQIELANKQVEIEGKILEAIKDMKTGGDDSTIVPLPSGLLKAIGGMLKGAAVSAATFIAEAAASTLGLVTAAVALPVAIAAVLESNKREEDVAESKERGYAVGGEAPSTSFFDVLTGGNREANEKEKTKANAKYSAYGYSGSMGHFIDAEGKPISDDKAREMRHAIDDPNNPIEGVKKNIAPKLEEKQEKAETAKEEKTNASMAGAVSNVVNNSPNNSVVAPSAPAPKGRDNPRNPDNSLSNYLNSRVLKFT